MQDRDGETVDHGAEESANAMTAVADGFIDDGKNTIASQLVDRLREAIVSGQLEAGSKINLQKARTVFQVSLSPLREALARLISDGLVTFEDNRGYRVAPMSLADLEEITSLRLEFEIYALREAIRLGDAAWEGNVVRALHRLNKEKREADSPATLEAWEQMHRAFHLTLISGCGKPHLMQFCSVLLNLNDRYRRTFLRATSGDRNVAFEHSEIAHAAVARDADYAAQKLHDHIRRTGGNLLTHISAKGLA
ncbi:DNA-binding GntR family transcriptional regulator [Aminobacter sp. J15]|nr:DNA-binding GntR family transcriptional regulator [Aminobacter sp. J44]TWH36616.1 DNA-binding GntR family transcriptional regulator [Aminobacter sp. J15]